MPPAIMMSVIPRRAVATVTVCTEDRPPVVHREKRTRLSRVRKREQEHRADQPPKRGRRPSRPSRATRRRDPGRTSGNYREEIRWSRSASDRSPVSHDFVAASSPLMLGPTPRSAGPPVRRYGHMTARRSQTPNNSGRYELTTDDRDPLGGQFTDHPVNLGLRPDVDPARGLVEEDHVGPLVQKPGQGDTFCWLPPRKPASRLQRTFTLHVDPARASPATSRRRGRLSHPDRTPTEAEVGDVILDRPAGADPSSLGPRSPSEPSWIRTRGGRSVRRRALDDDLSRRRPGRGRRPPPE